MPYKPVLRLLPNYFKKIGLVLMFLTGLAFIYFVISRPEVVRNDKDLVRLIFLSLLILSLTLIAVARDKMEDELIQMLRLQAMAFAFLYAVCHPIIAPILSLLLEGSWGQVSSHLLVLNMLVIYLLSFSFMKYTR